MVAARRRQQRARVQAQIQGLSRAELWMKAYRMGYDRGRYERLRAAGYWRDRYNRRGDNSPCLKTGASQALCMTTMSTFTPDGCVPAGAARIPQRGGLYPHASRRGLYAVVGKIRLRHGI
jgi:hypothetical protein